MPREKSFGAIIFRKELGNVYYLLLHQGKAWTFPKGHGEEGENEIQTVKREIEEETGIKDMKIIQGFKETEKYFFKKTYDLKPEEKTKASWIFKLVVFYLAQTQTEDIKISFEHTGSIWLPFEDALKKATFKNSKELLKKANNYIIKNKI